MAFIPGLVGNLSLKGNLICVDRSGSAWVVGGLRAGSISLGGCERSGLTGDYTKQALRQAHLAKGKQVNIPAPSQVYNNGWG